MNKPKKWVLLAAPGLAGFILIYIVPFAESTYYSFLSDIFDTCETVAGTFGKEQCGC